MSVTLVALALALVPVSGGSIAREEIDVSTPATRAAIQKGLAYLLEVQNKDGSWGGVRNATFTSRFANPATYHCWRVGTTALATQAMLEIGTGPEAGAAADRGIEYLILHARLRRPAEWDVDNVWGLIYALNTLSRAMGHERYRGTEMGARIRTAAVIVIQGMKRYQGPRGGWGYYANPSARWMPEWATSFTTAAGVLALLEAKEAGLPVPSKVYRASVRAVERSRLPNGAYGYSVDALPRHMRMESIDQVKGSIGRIQVCNIALHRAGAELPEGALVAGIEQFFRHHKFFDVGRNKPIPHEAYYAVAAYFYLFGHYYASQVIEVLPSDIRSTYAAKLRRDIIKCQQKDGSMWDFWIASMTKSWGTAFGVMSLARTLEIAE